VDSHTSSSKSSSEVCWFPLVTLSVYYCLEQDFRNFKELTYLNVNHNNLTEVPSCVLEIQELCTLLMKSNSIKFVSDDTILGLY
jgi:hypothetical protein